MFRLPRVRVVPFSVGPRALSISKISMSNAAADFFKKLYSCRHFFHSSYKDAQLSFAFEKEKKILVIFCMGGMLLISNN